MLVICSHGSPHGGKALERLAGRGLGQQAALSISVDLSAHVGPKIDTPDSEVARIAVRQHGAITRRQLEGAGLGARAIRNRIDRGQLHRIHRGVYAVGHRGLSLHGRFMAAVLACGEDGVLSHGSATVLWDLLRSLDGPIHVSTTSTSGRLRRPGIRARYLDLRARGFAVLRFDERQLEEEPERVAGDVARALGSSA